MDRPNTLQDIALLQALAVGLDAQGLKTAAQFASRLAGDLAIGRYAVPEVCPSSPPAPAPAWAEAKLPGDTVRRQRLERPGEQGDVVIQWYAETHVRVGSFLPGREVWVEGDTPKTEPERCDWVRTKDPEFMVEAANFYFDRQVAAAEADGWTRAGQ